MRYLILIIILTFCSNSFCQSDKEKVMIPINNLFNGMLKEDTSMIKKAFIEEPIMLTGFKSKTGKEIIKEDKLDNLIKAISTKEKGSDSWIEKLYNTSIKIDGNIAQVWTEYSFYVGESFSHCGVDAFQLIRVDGNWKIAHIMDTRRKEGCNVNK